MQLIDYLDQDLIKPDLFAQNKSEVLNELISPLASKYPGLDHDKIYRILMERENLGSTGIGDGVAIPHGKINALEQIILIVGRSIQGVDFDAIDGKQCHIFFLVIAPEDVAGLHLRILAHVSKLLKDPSFRKQFMDARGKEGLWDLLKSA